MESSSSVTKKVITSGGETVTSVVRTSQSEYRPVTTSTVTTEVIREVIKEDTRWKEECQRLQSLLADRDRRILEIERLFREEQTKRSNDEIRFTALLKDKDNEIAALRGRHAAFEGQVRDLENELKSWRSRISEKDKVREKLKLLRGKG
jgi:chromosome segregation ATPase